MCIRGFYRLGYEVGFARVSSVSLGRIETITDQSCRSLSTLA